MTRTPDDAPSLLDDAPAALSSLEHAQWLGEVVGRHDFDWSDAREAFAKLREEVDELAEHVFAPEPARDDLLDELGDVLFAAAMIGRKLGLSAEEALARTNAKFAARWRYIERALAREGSSTAEASLAQLERLWEQAKRSGGDLPA